MRGRWKEAAGADAGTDAACERLPGPGQSCAPATRALLPVQGPGAAQVCSGSAPCHPPQAGTSAPALLCRGLLCFLCLPFLLYPYALGSQHPVLACPDTWRWTQLPQAPAAGGWVQTHPEQNQCALARVPACRSCRSRADISPRWAVGRSDGIGEPDASLGWVTATKGPCEGRVEPRHHCGSACPCSI